MINNKRFLELDKSLKGENATEILKDIEERIWQINLVDRWQKQDREDYEIFCELKRIYKDIERKENERK